MNDAEGTANDVLAPKGNRTTKRPLSCSRDRQIRIRLQPSERRLMEEWQRQNFQTGHSYAETLSSWVRHQLRPLIESGGDNQSCHISQEKYERVEELARLLNRSPEEVVEACVKGIEFLIRETDVQRPLIVAEWRLREQYRRGGNGPDDPADKGRST